MKFGHLILRKVFKFVTTKCQILKLKCTKFDFGSTPDSAGRAGLPKPLAGFKGPTFSKGNGWEGWGMEGWEREWVGY